MSRRTISPLISPLLGVLAACAGEPSDPVVDSDDPIDKLFAPLGPLPVEAARRIEGDPEAPIADGDYQCVDTPIDEVKQYDQLLGQLSVGDVLWPGSMLRGDSVYTGRLTPIALPRAPLTFSVSLESLGGGARSATMESPTLSAYRDAVARILAQDVTGATPARISAEVEEVSSEEQLAVAIGAAVDAPIVASVKAGFDFSNQNVRSRFIVKFFQLYYTVDVDPPGLPHTFFAPGVTAGDVEPVLGANNPPVYVSSIGYGRQVMFTFESELAKSELSAALDFVYKGGVDISGNVSLTHREVLSHTHTTAFILGGDAGEAARASVGSYEELLEFIARGGNFSKDSPGAAIAYKLSYVRDHTPVQLSFASMYRQSTCSRVAQKLHVVLERMTVDNSNGDAGGNLEMYGDVIAIGANDQRRTLLSLNQSQYLTIPNGQSLPTSGILGEAIVAVTPQSGNNLRIETTLFDDDSPLGVDAFGTQTDAAPFDAGWRRTLAVLRSQAGQAVTLRVTLTPVP